MAAGLGFKDFVTGEVLTAADVDGYLMQGVWVFASAAARDAAVTSPQEGNFAYLKDTNVTTYYTGSAWANLDTTGMTNPMTTTGDTIYSSSGSTPARLGIGTTGQVLTVAGGVPSWASASSGALTLITSGSFSASSSISVNSCFSATYLNYKIVVDLTAQSGGCNFLARMRASGSDDTGGNYNNRGAYFDGSTNQFSDIGASSFQIGALNAAAQTFEGAVEFMLYAPFASTRTKFTALTAAPDAATFAAGVNKVTTSFDGITLRTSANDITGSYKIYGLAN